MSQNVTNNWFQKLNTDSSFLDKQTGTKSVGSTGSTFQSFLSQQIKKTNPSTTQNGVENSVEKGNTSKPIKRMDTTASKLSIKSPEKSVNTETDNEVKSDKISGNTDKLQAKETIGNDTQKVDDQNTEPSKEATETQGTEEGKEVTITEITPELMQLIQSLPKEIIEQLPEEIQNLLTEVSEMLKTAVTPSTPATAKSKMEMILETTKGMEAKLSKTEFNVNAIKPDVIEAIKTLVNELKSSPTGNTEMAKSFESILSQLNQLSKETPQIEVPKVATAKSDSVTAVQTQNQTDVISETVTTNNTGAKSNNGEAKSGFDGTFEGKKVVENTQENVEVKITTETKVNTENVVREFSAKTETASIAFGKQEVSNQSVKNALHTNIMDQLINSPKIQIKQTEQGAMMTLKLNPEVLGNVEIKMEIVKGVLQAEINVENMIVKGAIESNLSDLRNALSDKGYHVEALNVSVGQENNPQREQQQQQRSQEREKFFTADEMEAINGTYDFETVVNDTRIDYLG